MEIYTRCFAAGVSSMSNIENRCFACKKVCLNDFLRYIVIFSHMLKKS